MNQNTTASQKTSNKSSKVKAKTSSSNKSKTPAVPMETGSEGGKQNSNIPPIPPSLTPRSALADAFSKTLTVQQDSSCLHPNIPNSFVTISENSKGRTQLRFQNSSGPVRTLVIGDILQWILTEVNKNSPTVATQLEKLFEHHFADNPMLDEEFILVSGILAVRNTPAEEKKNKLEALGDQLAVVVNKKKDFFLGSSQLGKDDDDVRELLEDLVLIPYKSFVELDSVDDLRVHFDKERKALAKIPATGSTQLLETADRLCHKLRKLTTNTLQVAFLLGQTVSLLKLQKGLKWVEVEDRLRLGRTTLYKYRDCFVFLSKYPRFLRAVISVSALIKYSKKIERFLSKESELSVVWSSLED